MKKINFPDIGPKVAVVLLPWLVLTASEAVYMLFRIFVRHDYKELESVSGEEYLKYKSNSPEFIPNPFKIF